MSSAITELQPTQFSFAVRFDQGYRYLDRCGEAIVRLEETLDEGWIPGDINPSGGQLRNYTLGLAATFGTASLSVNQTEFMSFEHFQDQTCKVFEVLRVAFDIRRVVTPALRVVYQLGFPDVEIAHTALRSLQLCRPDRELVKQLSGNEEAMDLTLTTREEITWQGAATSRRRRIEAKVVRQERQPVFDDRIMQRLQLLPSRYHETIRAIRALRRQHSMIVDVAAQFDFENSLEGEFSSSTLDVATFLRGSRAWSQEMEDFIRTRIKVACQNT